MLQKRRKDQIVFQVLMLCRDGANKTRIVYQVNLNFKTVNGYLDSLLEKRLLEAIPCDRRNMIIYKTTPEGERALEVLQKSEEITF